MGVKMFCYLLYFGPNIAPVTQISMDGVSSVSLIVMIYLDIQKY